MRNGLDCSKSQLQSHASTLIRSSNSRRPESSFGNFKKPSEALAHILKLHQEATTAFGKEFTTQYDLCFLKIISFNGKD